MINPYVTHSTGGVQRQIFLQSRGLSDLKHTVYILQRHDPLLVGEKMNRWNKAKFLQTPAFIEFLPESLGKLFFILFGFLLLWRHRKKIDVVHAHQLSSPTLIGGLAKFALGMPLIAKATAGGSWGEIRELSKGPLFRIRRIFFKKIDKLIALTEAMKTEATKWLPIPSDRMILLPNGVDIPLEISAMKLEEQFRILYCGRLSNEKRIDLILKAADRLSSIGKICVDLVGPRFQLRDATPELQRIADQIGDHIEIHFHGDQNDPAFFYKNANVFVLPSQSEGMSNSLLEAMAFGLCCVVSDTSENKVLIEHNVSGLTFELDQLDSLVDRLTTIYKDQKETRGAMSRSLGVKAREKVLHSYSSQMIARCLQDLYQNCLTETAPPS